MIAAFWLEEFEESFFELAMPILFTPAAFWLGAWIFWRVAQINARHSA